MNFYVHASNIHTNESQRYGPFPGTPGLTYELLRCFAPNGETHPMDGEHIFTYREEREGASFIHRDDGDNVSFGWRRTLIRPIRNFNAAKMTGVFSQEETGPIWTDLFIELTEDEPIRSNLVTVGEIDAATDAAEIEFAKPLPKVL